MTSAIFSSCITLAFVALATALPVVPDPSDKAAMARWLVAGTPYGVISTISSTFGGVPFGNVQALSDGPPGNWSGVPYFLTMEGDPSFDDSQRNASASVSITMEAVRAERCTIKGLDVEDPRCARLTLLGDFVEVKDAAERKFANASLVARHPAMAAWWNQPGHPWKICKLDIKNIWLLDDFGGGAAVDTTAYWHAAP